jgi:hypothetical protein
MKLFMNEVASTKSIWIGPTAATWIESFYRLVVDGSRRLPGRVNAALAQGLDAGLPTVVGSATRENLPVIEQTAPMHHVYVQKAVAVGGGFPKLKLG